MSRPSTLAASIVAAAFFLAPSDGRAQATAFLRGADAGSPDRGERGAAILFSRGGTCYAVTPMHVLRDSEHGIASDYARLVVARVGRPPIEAQSDLCAIVPSLDLALTRVSGVASGPDCGVPLLGSPSTDRLLATNTEAWVGTTAESGRVIGRTLVLRAVASGEASSFYASPVERRDDIGEGMSGSLVAIGGQPVGMLISVNRRIGDPTAGTARILRLDRIADEVNRLFSARTDAETVSERCFGPSSSAELASRSVADPALRDNLASDACGAHPTVWTAPPLSADERPENLTRPGGIPWRVRVLGEASIDVALCASPAGIVSQLTLDTSACPPGDNATRYDVEALIRTAPRGGFSTLAFGRLPAHGRLDLSSGSPLRGNELRLRFVARDAGAATLCLAPLVVR